MQGQPWKGDVIALVLGLLMPLAYSPFDLPLLSLILVSALFLLWYQSPGRRACWRGWLFGFGMFSVGVYPLAHAVDPFLLTGGIEQVGFSLVEGQFTAAARGDVTVNDSVDFRRAPEVILVPYQGDILLSPVFLESKRTCADRMHLEFVTHLFHGFLGDDISAMIIGYQA